MEIAVKKEQKIRRTSQDDAPYIRKEAARPLPEVGKETV